MVTKQNKTKYFVREPNENTLFFVFFVLDFVRTKKTKITKQSVLLFLFFFVQKTGYFKEQNKIC